MPVKINFLQTPNQSLFVGDNAPREYIRSGMDDFEAGLVRLSVKGLCNYLLNPMSCDPPAGPAQQYCIVLPIKKLFNESFFRGARQDLILYGSSFRVPGECKAPLIQSAAPKVEEKKVEVKAKDAVKAKGAVKKADAKLEAKSDNKEVKAACSSCNKGEHPVEICPPPTCCADDQVVLARSVRVSGVKPICDGENVVYKFMSSDELLAAWALYGIPVHSVIVDGIYEDQIKKSRRAPFDIVASNNQNVDAFVASGDAAEVSGVGPGFCDPVDYKIKRHRKKRSHKKHRRHSH